MKIKNISNNNKNITSKTVEIVLTTKGGTKRNLKLSPGDYVYGENLDNNMPVRIFQQKGVLEVIKEEKPNDFDYYTVYREEEENKNLFKKILKNIFSKEEDLTADEIVTSDILETPNETIEELNDVVEIEIIVPEDSLKNKGGRPKGSTNKKKKKKPKAKKPIGRPSKNK